ncbi:hypothetical protein QTJ16_004172 [Diplocarpon rosae]|uniref:Uncharacterized protein n=1 Tax=Diplocarpon rosae TaxID=946125 RepID=A0AAD9T0Q2_9HELO|nr:hypothetical protein QTJ16_004172 [Diplocarpon rosae]
MTEDEGRKLIRELVKASYSFLAAPSILSMNSIMAQQPESCLTNFLQAAPELSYTIPNTNPATLEALLYSVLQIAFNSAYSRFERTGHGESEKDNLLTTVKTEYLFQFKRATEVVEVHSGAVVGGSNHVESAFIIKREADDAGANAEVHFGAAIDSSQDKTKSRYLF